MPQPIRYPELGAKLETTREQKSREASGNVSLRSISQTTNVDYGHIHRVFHGQSLPSREILLSICKTLKCTSRESAEIFALTDYRAPSSEELEDEERPKYRKRNTVAA